MSFQREPHLSARRNTVVGLVVFGVVAIAALLCAQLPIAQGDERPFQPSRWNVIFDDVPVGATSPSQEVTIRNGGNGPLTFAQVTIGGPHNRDFVLASDTCAERRLDADEMCQVAIRFRPTVKGTRVAHLRFDQKGRTCANWITLAGSGPQQATARIASCDDDNGQPSAEPGTTSAGTPGPAGPSETTPGTSETTPGTSSTVLANSAIGLPARSCRSRRAFKITINPPRGMRFTSVTVKLNNRNVRVIRGRRIMADVSLRGRPRGRFALHVVAETASGRILQRTRHYVTCVRDRST